MSSAKKRRDNLKAQIARQDLAIELGGAKSMATMWQAGAIKLGEENAVLRAENAAQLAELHSIDIALGTDEGHSAVYWIEALKKDAERYRWLQDINTASYVWVGEDGLFGAALDAAIDAEKEKMK